MSKGENKVEMGEFFNKIKWPELKGGKPGPKPKRKVKVTQAQRSGIGGIGLAESLGGARVSEMEPAETEGDKKRDAQGRFVRGHALGGRPKGVISPQMRWRNEFEAAIRPGDIEKAILKVIEAAHAGKPWAARELFDRTFGRPQQYMDMQVDASISFAGVLARLCEVAGDD